MLREVFLEMHSLVFSFSRNSPKLLHFGKNLSHVSHIPGLYTRQNACKLSPVNYWSIDSTWKDWWMSCNDYGYHARESLCSTEAQVMGSLFRFVKVFLSQVELSSRANVLLQAVVQEKVWNILLVLLSYAMIWVRSSCVANWALKGYAFDFHATWRVGWNNSCCIGITACLSYIS